MTRDGTDRLIPVEESPYNAEAPLEALVRPAEPGPCYVRNHFDVPRLPESEWRLRVEGKVDRPLRLTAEELDALPEESLTMTLECAGNGRKLMEPTPGGTPWGLGAVSVVRFTGVPLRAVLERAGADPEAPEVLFVGADRGEVEPGRTEAFARSLPRQAVRRPDVLLARRMNGRPLPPRHGAPLRLVVPGWYGMASVKWLEGIEVRGAPFRGYFQANRYVYLGEEGTPDGTPVTRIRVRAAIARPADGARLTETPVEVRGAAWSGAGRIERVEVSADGGESWAKAEVGRQPSRHVPAPWRYTWSPSEPGRHTLVARARDESSAVQPLESRWNRLGYGNNVAQRVEVTVA